MLAFSDLDIWDWASNITCQTGRCWAFDGWRWNQPEICDECQERAEARYNELAESWGGLIIPEDIS